MADSIYAEAAPDTKRAWRRLPRLTWVGLRLVWDADRSSFIASGVLQLTSAAGLAAQLLVGKRVLDAILGAARGDGTLTAAVPQIVVLGVLMAVIGYANDAASAKRRLLIERTMGHFSALTLDVATTVDLEAFDHAKFFDRMRRTGQDGMWAGQAIASSVIDLIAATASLVAIGATLAFLEPLLLPMVVVAYVPLWAVISGNARVGYSFVFGNTPGDRMRQSLSDIVTWRESAKEVRTFGVFGFLLERWRASYDERIRDVRKLERTTTRRSLAANVGTAVLQGLAYAALVWMVTSGRLTVASGAAAAVAVRLLGARMEGVATTVSWLYRRVLFLEDFVSFLRLRDAVRERRPTQPPPSSFDVVDAERVTFRYPDTDKDALTDASIRIARGEVVALVGENGSGKTTLAKLLCSLYTPAAGAVRWGGRDVAEWDPEQVRRSVSVIFQDFLRYPLPAHDNVAIGNPARADDLEALREAARAAGADAFLAALPAGYDTPLNRMLEGGVDLSTGEWQRVALARAFFRDAPFIVLDEPTAALDPRGEHELFRSIRTLCAGRAVLLISHRFSSVREADRIYVLHQGRVVEHGSHAELMAAGGRYAELFTLQAAAYGDADDPALLATRARLTQGERSTTEAAATQASAIARQAEPAKPQRHLRTLPAIARDGLRLSWQAGRGPLSGAVALQLLAGAALGLQVLLAQRALTAVIGSATQELSALQIASPLAALFGVTAVIGFARAASIGREQTLVEMGVRHADELTLRVAGEMPYERFDQPAFYDRLRRARTQGTMSPSTVTRGLVSLAASVLGVAGLMAALLRLEPVLVPLVVLAYIPAWIATSYNSAALYSFSVGHTPAERQRQHLEYLLRMKEAAAEVRALCAAELLMDRWQQLWGVRMDEIRGLVRDHMRRALKGGVTSSVLRAGTLGLLAWMVLTGRTGIAAAAAAGIAIQQLGAQLASVGSSVNMLYDSGLYLRDLTSFLDEGRAFREAPRGTPAPPPFTDLAVEDVSFVYPGSDRMALERAGMRIRAGEIVALVGENGSGKTTLAKLLCALYPPGSGRITWDGADVAPVDPDALRRRVAVIFQEFVRYPLTAGENVGVGDAVRMGDTSRIAEAARATGADFLEDLPKGMDTMLGRQFEDGAELSVGQWQRVALARAFFRDAPFIVLDEPTAALDPRAEHELFRSIRTLCAGRAVLLISHRFSSVREADRIVVLHEGRVVETGTHAELMATGGRYAELFTLQASAYLGQTRSAAV